MTARSMRSKMLEAIPSAPLGRTWRVLIVGPVVAQERSGSGRAIGGRVVRYTPAKTATWRRNAIRQVRFLWNHGVIRSPCDVRLTVVLPRPKHRPDYVPAEDWSDGVRTYAVGRKDNDNLEKNVFDALVQAGVLIDDRWIVSNSTVKVYGCTDEGECVIVQVKTLAPDAAPPVG